MTTLSFIDALMTQNTTALSALSTVKAKRRFSPTSMTKLQQERDFWHNLFFLCVQGLQVQPCSVRAEIVFQAHDNRGTRENVAVQF